MARSRPKAFFQRAPGTRLASTRSASGAFTLVELMVVLTILGALLGLGVGMVARMETGQGRVKALVRSRLSTAHSAARCLGVPAWVEFFPGKGKREGLTLVRSTKLAPLLSLPFDRLSATSFGLVPTFFGAEIRGGGRFGCCLSHLEPGQHGVEVRTTGMTHMKLEVGFLVRCDCKVEVHGGMNLIKWGETFTLGIGDNGLPEGKITLAGKQGMPGKRLEVRGTDPVPLGNWFTLELFHDGSKVYLHVSGTLASSVEAKGMVFQRPDKPIIISDGNKPCTGLLDEVRLYSLDYEEPDMVPDEASLVEGPTRILFSPGGNLDPREHGSDVKLVFSTGSNRRLEVLVSRLGVVQ